MQKRKKEVNISKNMIFILAIVVIIISILGTVLVMNSVENSLTREKDSQDYPDYFESSATGELSIEILPNPARSEEL